MLNQDQVECPNGDAPLAALIKHPGQKLHEANTDARVFHDWSGGDLDVSTVNDAVDCISNGEIVGAHFHRAISADVCRKVVEQAQEHPDKTHYDGAPGVGRIQIPIFDIQHLEGGLQKYLNMAPMGLAQTRKMFGGALNPIDLFRILLDEGKSKSCRLLRLLDRPCMAGIFRYMEHGAAIGWHVDSICWDLPDIHQVQQIESQLSIVCVLSEGESGGDTIICPTRLSSLQYDANRLSGDEAYAIDPSFLPRDRVVLKGKVGDILLFESRYPHMVTELSGPPRFTISAFVGVCRDGSRVLFS